MSNKNRVFYAIASGLLLGFPWYQVFSGVFLLVAFIPLLFIEHEYAAQTIRKPKNSLFLYASLSFLIWNITATWWIAKASLIGALAAILINTFLFSVVFWLFYLTHKVAGKIIGWIAFVSYWTAFEYLYLNAEISWPWLNIGNGFAHDIRFVQWYEYTGTLGGTVWALLANIVFFEMIKNYLTEAKKRKLLINLIIVVIIVCLPIVFSTIRFYTYQEKGESRHVAIVQPDIDPYDMAVTAKEQCFNMKHIIDSVGNPSTDYFIAPETAIMDDIWETSLSNNFSLYTMRKMMERYPKAHFIFGATTFKEFPDGQPRTETARPLKSDNSYYDSYNTALQIDSTAHILLYHKSKLVAGIEKMPYQKTLKFFEKLIVKCGGSVASHATQTYRGIFESSDKTIRVAPVICYESAYGEFVTGYIKNGANLIFILTNDGWWGDTPGYHQHLSYASIRAIETRRDVARSANTGISAFINQRGEIVASMGWGKRGAIEASVNANDDFTFYSRHGDWLGRLACCFSVCSAVIAIVLFVKDKITI